MNFVNGCTKAAKLGQNGSITGMSDEIALTLSDEQKRRIVVGSKCLLAGWCVYVTLIWVLKACMLFLYGRLTYELNRREFYLSHLLIVSQLRSPAEAHGQSRSGSLRGGIFVHYYSHPDALYPDTQEMADISVSWW